MWGKAARAPRKATKPSRRTAEQTQNQNTGTPQALPHHPLPVLDPPCQNGSAGSAPHRAGPEQGSGGAPTRAGPGRRQAAREGCNRLGPTQSGPAALRGRVRSPPLSTVRRKGRLAAPGPAPPPSPSSPGPAQPLTGGSSRPQSAAHSSPAALIFLGRCRGLAAPPAPGAASLPLLSPAAAGGCSRRPERRGPFCEAAWPRPRGGAAAGGPRLPAGSLSPGGLGGGCGEEPALPAPVLGRGWALCSPQGSQQLVSA